jgi:hypothetical protein
MPGQTPATSIHAIQVKAVVGTVQRQWTSIAAGAAAAVSITAGAAASRIRRSEEAAKRDNDDQT